MRDRIYILHFSNEQAGSEYVVFVDDDSDDIEEWREPEYRLAARFETKIKGGWELPLRRPLYSNGA